ncbi:hypothetical protein OH77DRAFT_978824 [Trametes cingulata]|nr:hypothetical protein OH77DRAFT_978824 [Trametes cingulata]
MRPGRHPIAITPSNYFAAALRPTTTSSHPSLPIRGALQHGSVSDPAGDACYLSPFPRSFWRTRGWLRHYAHYGLPIFPLRIRASSRELKLVCQGISPACASCSHSTWPNRTQPVAQACGGGAGTCRHCGYKRSAPTADGKAGTPAIFALHHSTCVHPLHVCTGVVLELWRPQGLTRYRFYTRQQALPLTGHSRRYQAPLDGR